MTNGGRRTTADIQHSPLRLSLSGLSRRPPRSSHRSAVQLFNNRGPKVRCRRRLDYTTTLAPRTEVLWLLALHPNERFFCDCCCCPPDSMLLARLAGPVGRSASLSASALSEVSSYPHQLKRLRASRPKPQHLGDPTLVLYWAGGILRPTRVYTALQRLVYLKTRFAEPRNDVTVTPTIPWLVKTSVIWC